MSPDELNPFQHGFFEAMFFTNFGVDDGELCGKGFSDLAQQVLDVCLTDCRKFERENESHILRAIEVKTGYDDESAGRDFWFTRNGHGVGFWDRGLGEAGDLLTAAAKKYNTLEPYLGDDGKVWLG